MFKLWLRCKLKFSLLSVVICCGSLLFSQAFAWNAEGHRLVAKIAYDKMTVAARHTFDTYIKAIDNSSFEEAAVWLDKQRSGNMFWLKPLHYYDIPFSTDGTKTTEPAPANAVSALMKAKAVLQDPNASLAEKALYTRILIHVLADIHQPMHTVSRFNRNHPNGDKGGNLFFLKSNGIASNLHAYWDKGGGWLAVCKPSKYSTEVKRARGRRKHHKSRNHCTFDTKKLSERAYLLEQEYPCDTASLEFNPSNWARESYEIAVSKAYTIRMRQRPSQTYQQMVKEISQKRIALAGCRLAALLNHL